jgi:vacuolar-type H+-ATPase subunit E/Vma4
MSNQGKNYDLLLSEITKQSRKEIKEIKDQAEKERQDTISKARRQGEKITSEIRQKTEQQGDELKKKILSNVHLEIKKRNLENQEKLISRLSTELRKKLDEFRHADHYKQILKEWIREGASVIDKKDLILTVGKIERNFINKNFLQDVVDKIKDQKGNVQTCKLNDTVLDEGGVIVSDAEGKIRFNNSFSARIQRKQDEIRLLIVNKFME